MIKEYNIRTDGSQYIRFQTFRGKGMDISEKMLPIERKEIDIQSLQMYFREKIETHKSLVIQDTVKAYPVYRSLSWNVKKEAYEDVEKNIPFTKDFLLQINYNKVPKLHFVEFFGGIQLDVVLNV